MSLPDEVKFHVDSVLSSFCATHIPPHARDQVALSFEFRGNAVTLFEHRRRWNKPEEWGSSAIAQFRFDSFGRIN